MITLKGLILREKNIGETSRLISVLTAEKGVIDIFIRGGQKSSKNSSGSQLFAYSKLCIDEKRNAKGQVEYFLNSCESERLFYNIRLDVKKTALASYFAELLLFSRTEESGYEDIMRLSLNTLYFLNENKQNDDLLKSIFELRLPCEIGLRPSLVGCCQCYKYEDEQMHFDFNENKLYCDDCFSFTENTNEMTFDKTLLYIVRFIALTEFERLFAFKISENYQKKLTEFTEKFVRTNFKKSFHALDFYKMI